jgi:hypothetical protein
VTAIEDVSADDISDDEAGQSGFESAPALLEYLGDGTERDIFCVKFTYLGVVRKTGPDQSVIGDAAEFELLAGKLDSKDKGDRGAWTIDTLKLIRTCPATSSAILADRLNRDQAELKKDIRKLKHLGLTVSLDTGYCLSDKGVSYLVWRGV